MRIKESDKILIIAPHPDDEVIALGGFIAKYHSQIDVLCINSSGVANNANGDNAEEIADMRINEFYDVMKTANVNSYNITKIFGVPPMIKQIKNKNYIQSLRNCTGKKLAIGIAYNKDNTNQDDNRRHFVKIEELK